MPRHYVNAMLMLSLLRYQHALLMPLLRLQRMPCDATSVTAARYAMHVMLMPDAAAFTD